ncbi:hypothetical protein FGG08_005111 [Glutinoglossum americanum]|uniref:non-specific serine/threonine protein kinase n=1 Tax=Glutinoglossum americanum TaxID=1670608 RepID=A0A9P8L1S0_9PEZI|nr:hypothetical protein FGG08_005111 [Glutinoglossum americanum]
MEAIRDRKARKQKTYGKSTAKKVFSAAFEELSPGKDLSRRRITALTETVVDPPRVPLSSLSTNSAEPPSSPPATGYLSGKLSNSPKDKTWRNAGPVGYSKSRQLTALRSNSGARAGGSNGSISEALTGKDQNQGPTRASRIHQLAPRGQKGDIDVDELNDSLPKTPITSASYKDTSLAGASKAHQAAAQTCQENTRTDTASDNLLKPSAEPVLRRVGPIGYSKSFRQVTRRFKDAARVNELNGGLLRPSTSTAYRDQSYRDAYPLRCQLSATAISQQKGNTNNPVLAKDERLAKDIGKPKKKPALKKISTRDKELNSYENQLAKLCSLSINPNGPLEFQAWANIASQKLTVLKIAEASYGEVYRLQSKCEKEIEAEDRHSVVKVIAIQPFRMPKNSKLKKSQLSPISEIISEVGIMDRMADIPGFVVFKGLHVVRGKLAKQYADAWTTYHNIDPTRSLFPNPNNKSTYSNDQLWAIIEMEDAGDELSDVPMNTFTEAWDIFWGVALALAKGEDMARFEHRDLHTGNVCVSRSNPSTKLNPSPTPTSSPRKFGLSGFATTIIDYTLSRADTDEPRVSAGDSQSRVIFTDLDRDKALFEAEGDYQYDIYRMMRSSIYHTYYPDTLNIWRNYHPLTNVYWLHHLVVVLLGKLDISQNERTESGQNNAIESFGPEGTFHSDFLELEHLVNPKGDGKFTTAGEIVAWALDNKWLKPADIDNVV